MDKKFTRRQIVRSAAAGLLFTVTPTAFAKAAPQFVAVRIWPANAYSRITLESTEKLQYNYFTLDNPRRLVLDLKGVQLNEVLQSINSKVQRSDPYIGIIRVGQNTADTVRIVIDLKTDVNPQLFTLAPVANFKHRLVADLYPMHAQDANDPLMALLEDYSKGKISNQGTGSGTPPVQPPPEGSKPTTTTTAHKKKPRSSSRTCPLQQVAATPGTSNRCTPSTPTSTNWRILPCQTSPSAIGLASTVFCAAYICRVNVSA